MLAACPSGTRFDSFASEIGRVEPAAVVRAPEGVMTTTALTAFESGWNIDQAAAGERLPRLSYTWRDRKAGAQFLALFENYELARELNLPNQMDASRAQAYALFVQDVAWTLWDQFVTPEVRPFKPFTASVSWGLKHMAETTSSYERKTFDWNFPSGTFEFHLLQRYGQLIPTRILRILKRSRELGVPYDYEWVGVKQESGRPARDPLLALSIAEWVIPIAFWI